MSVKEEEVLVFPARLLSGEDAFQGVLPINDTTQLLFKSIKFHARFLARSKAESDPRYKQLIPYVVFQYDEPGGETQLFSYVRGDEQGEVRLHAKMSIGVGGHINKEDVAYHDDPYVNGLIREMSEEVSVETRTIGSNTPVALINDDSNDVGRVHLGCVHVYRVNNPHVTAKEKSMASARFRPLSELFQQIDLLETWSQLVLRAFYAPALTESGPQWALNPPDTLARAGQTPQEGGHPFLSPELRKSAADAEITIRENG